MSDSGVPAQAASRRPPYAAESSIRAFFDRMQGMREPQLVDSKWVENYGLGGSQSHAVVGLLKWLRVVDAAGRSTGVWNDLRTDQPAALQKLVRESYGPIFDSIEIETADRKMIEGAFINAYRSGDTQRPVTAFMTLCTLAGVKMSASEQPRRPAVAATSKRASKTTTKTPKPKEVSQGSGPSEATSRGVLVTPGITISLLVELPADWDEARVTQRIRDIVQIAKATVDP